jgi:hypothetical protein
LEVPLQPLGPSFLLQSVLLSDLVGCDSPLHIKMAVSRFFKFDGAKQPLQGSEQRTDLGVFFKGREAP